MTPRALIVRPAAEHDLVAAALWFSTQREGLDEEFGAEVLSVFGRIAELPHAFPNVGVGIRRAALQRFPYVVYYTAPATGPVVVIGCSHKRRDPKFFMAQLAGRQH